MPRPLTRPTGSDAQPTLAGTSQRNPQVLLGSSFVAVLTVVLTASLLMSVAGAPIINASLAGYLLLMTVGYLAASGGRLTEPHLRRMGAHTGWRATTAAYLLGTAAIIVTVPLGAIVLMDRWPGLNRAAANIGPSSDAVGQVGFIELESGLNGVATVMTAAVACAVVPWLLTTRRERISPRQRTIALVVLTAVLGIARALTLWVLPSRSGLITEIPAVEAVVLGAAVAAVPRSFIHRNPPRGLWLPALAITGAALLIPPQLSPQALITYGIHALAVLGLTITLIADRLGLTSKFQGGAGFDRLANHLVSLVPATVAWQAATVALTVGRAELTNQSALGAWDRSAIVVASTAISLAAAGLTKSRMVDPIRRVLVGRSNPKWLPMLWSPQRAAQFALLETSRFRPPPPVLWDEAACESIGRPLPIRPAVPIRTSKILHPGRAGSTSHRGRRTIRDQIPPPERHIGAHTDEQTGVAAWTSQAESTPSPALEHQSSYAEPSGSLPT